MKAMIFAAGLGTRLRPLTDNCPKALIPVGGKPMLQRVIEHLKANGFDELIINVHYLGDHIRQFLSQHQNFGLRIVISDETDELLETGGGLWKARDFFDDGTPFLVCNADILTNIDVKAMLQQHQQSGAMATLAVRNRITSRYLLFDNDDVLFGWVNNKTDEIKITRKIAPEAKMKMGLNETYPLHEFAFSGYQILSPEIFKYQRREGKFSMIDWYLDICGSHRIQAYHHDDDIWIDIGSQASLDAANQAVISL